MAVPKCLWSPAILCVPRSRLWSRGPWKFASPHSSGAKGEQWSPPSPLGCCHNDGRLCPHPSPPTPGSTEGPTLPLYYNLFHIKSPPSLPVITATVPAVSMFISTQLAGGRWALFSASLQWIPGHLCKEIQRPFTRSRWAFSSRLRLSPGYLKWWPCVDWDIKQCRVFLLFWGPLWLWFWDLLPWVGGCW